MKKKNDIPLFIEFVLLALLLIFYIIGLIIPEFKIIIQLLMIATLFYMTYNNETIFKRKYMSFVYIILAIYEIYLVITNG